MSSERDSSGFRQLGVCRRNVRALLLLPLACVAWASRRRHQPELEALFNAAADQAVLDEEARELARRWLDEEPPPHARASGLELLSALAAAADEPLVTQSDVIRAVVWACCAAQLDREPTAQAHKAVSASARRAVRMLERTLQVDIGELWADVLAELGEELPRSRNAVPPRVRLTPDSSRDSLPHELARADLPPLDALAFTRRQPSSTPFPLLRRSGD